MMRSVLALLFGLLANGSLMFVVPAFGHGATGCLDSASEADVFVVELDCRQPAEPIASLSDAAQASSIPMHEVRQAACLAIGMATLDLPLLATCIPADSNGSADPPEDMNAVLLRAVERIKPPEVRVLIEPPGGRTLVNFDTIFRAEATPYTEPVRLLGRRILLQIVPSSFTWHHGDASSQTTDWPGRSYERGVAMDSFITHRYSDAHVTVRPRVDVTYTARFSLDNGQGWTDIVGRVTIPGPPGQLRVLEADPVLVAG